MSSHVSHEVQGRIGYITIDRADKLNALSTEINNDLRFSFQSLEEMDIQVIIFQTAGDRAFIAGADLDEYHGLSEQEYLAFQKNGRNTNDYIYYHPAIVIAAVDGIAYGGGFELALVSDLIVAEEGAEFALPEAKLGLLPGGGATQRLPSVIGRNKTIELLTTGKPIGADEAKNLGLVNRLVNEGEAGAEAKRLAEDILENGPLAVEKSKEVVKHGLDASLETGLAYEHAVGHNLYQTDDAKEGISAFVEDRTPQFQGH